jgi:hypothetical protein
MLRDQSSCRQNNERWRAYLWGRLEGGSSVNHKMNNSAIRGDLVDQEVSVSGLKSADAQSFAVLFGHGKVISRQYIDVIGLLTHTQEAPASVYQCAAQG